MPQPFSFCRVELENLTDSNKSTPGCVKMHQRFLNSHLTIGGDKTTRVSFWCPDAPEHDVQSMRVCKKSRQGNLKTAFWDSHVDVKHNRGSELMHIYNIFVCPPLKDNQRIILPPSPNHLMVIGSVLCQMFQLLRLFLLLQTAPEVTGGSHLDKKRLWLGVKMMLPLVTDREHHRDSTMPS